MMCNINIFPHSHEKQGNILRALHFITRILGTGLKKTTTTQNKQWRFLERSFQSFTSECLETEGPNKAAKSVLRGLIKGTDEDRQKTTTTKKKKRLELEADQS